jgi:hypothetical protein
MDEETRRFIESVRQLRLVKAKRAVRELEQFASWALGALEKDDLIGAGYHASSLRTTADRFLDALLELRVAEDILGLFAEEK